MKKNKLISVVAIILGVVALLLVYKKRSGTINDELQDFAVNDTASITKIFLANRNSKSVTLERVKNDGWVVNGKYKARRGGIKIILETIKSLAVKTRVAKAGYNNVIKGLAAEGVKCEIYQHGENHPVKVYYVGGSTADVLGTFMLLENSDLPFVVHIPGFMGYLSTRYSPLEEDWRDRSVFDYKPDEIKKISVNYFQDESKSFSIEKTGNQYAVTSPVPGKKIQHPDTLAIFDYLSLFHYLCFENWDNEFNGTQRDSLKTTSPISVIAVTDMSGKTTSMITYPKPVTKYSLAQTDTLDKPLKYDLDRMYAYINDGKDFVLIQYYVFGKIFRQFDDFERDLKHGSRKLSGE